MACLVFIVCFLSFSPALAAADQPPTAEGDFMSWRLIEQKRVSDGGTAVLYELRLPGGGRSVENLEVYYSVKPWEYRRGAPRRFGPFEYYAVKLSGEPSRPRLNLYEGRAARLEIVAGAMIGGRFQSARTLLNVYGEANGPDAEARRVSALPLWPGLRLPRAGYYRAVTGRPIYFETGAGARVTVFEEGREAADGLVNLGGGTYSYTPPLDPVLSAPGYSEKRDVLLAAALGDGLASCYLPVSRDYYGHQRLGPGLLVLLLTMLVSLGTIILAGRSFNWARPGAAGSAPSV